ncbi:MAG: BC1881 family protein [Emergencia sp.]
MTKYYKKRTIQERSEVKRMDFEKEKEELKKYPTCELVEELKKREGVKAIIADPHESLNMNVVGPAVILNIID